MPESVWCALRTAGLAIVQHTPIVLICSTTTLQTLLLSLLAHALTMVVGEHAVPGLFGALVSFRLVNTKHDD